MSYFNTQNISLHNSTTHKYNITLQGHSRKYDFKGIIEQAFCERRQSQSFIVQDISFLWGVFWMCKETNAEVNYARKPKSKNK